MSVADKVRLPLLVAVGVVLTACVTPNPEKATIVAQPKTAAVRTITNFSESLACMDRLLLAHNKRNIRMTSNNIPDATGKMQAGTRTMLISALKEMSQVSGAFQYYDYDGVQGMQGAGGDSLGAYAQWSDPTIPDYYIRGEITQVDSGVSSGGASIGLTTGVVDAGLTKNASTSLISLDMHMGLLQTRQQLAYQSRNQIAVTRTDQGADAGAMIMKAGINFSINRDESEGSHQALRTLIELGAIELMGKFTGVPYWRCLSIPETEASVIKQKRDWFDAMTEDQRKAMVIQKLAAQGYLPASSQTVAEGTLTDAIGRYQADHSLVATGRISFELYSSLNVDATATAVALPPVTQAEATELGNIGIVFSSAAPGGRYTVGSKLAFGVAVSRTSNLYCYFQDLDRSIFRVFPNRFVTRSHVSGQRAVNFPDETMGNHVYIELDRPGAAEVRCFATDDDLAGKLSTDVGAVDLEPLRVTSLDAVASAFKNTGAKQLSQRSYKISVK